MTYEKMGFLDKKEKVHADYKPMMMPNLQNFNNYIGAKPFSNKVLPKNMPIDKVLSLKKAQMYGKFIYYKRKDFMKRIFH
jgi:hypothetical protein